MQQWQYFVESVTTDRYFETACQYQSDVSPCPAYRRHVAYVDDMGPVHLYEALRQHLQKITKRSCQVAFRKPTITSVVHIAVVVVDVDIANIVCSESERGSARLEKNRFRCWTRRRRLPARKQAIDLPEPIELQPERVIHIRMDKQIGDQNPNWHELHKSQRFIMERNVPADQPLNHIDERQEIEANDKTDRRDDPYLPNTQPLRRIPKDRQ